MDVLIRIEDESASFLAVLLRDRTQEAQRCIEICYFNKRMMFLSVVGEWMERLLFVYLQVRFDFFLNSNFFVSTAQLSFFASFMKL